MVNLFSVIDVFDVFSCRGLVRDVAIARQLWILLSGADQTLCIYYFDEQTNDSPNN